MLLLRAAAPALPLPGTLSNPFTGSGGGNDSSSGREGPHTMSYEDYLGRDEQWGANRHDRCGNMALRYSRHA